jgi:hypothetical protein
MADDLRAEDFSASSPLKERLLEAVQEVPDARQAKLAPAKAGVTRSEAYLLCVERRGMKPNAADGTFSTAS